MTPAFRIAHVNYDLTALLSDRLQSITLTDQAGVVADQFEMVLDNRNDTVVIPGIGVEVSLALGYAGRELYDMGRYTIDELETSGMARSITLRGKSADMKASFKSQKKRNWEKMTLGAIVTAIAGEHGMTARVASRFAGIEIDHLDQLYESDMNLLTRMAEQVGAIMKPAGGNLLFVERGAGVAANGEPLPTVPILAEQVIDWTASIHERQRYACVGAHWQDKRGAAVRYVYAGEGDPIMYLRHPYKSERDALSAAEAKRRALARGRTSLSVSLVEAPMICAEMPVVLSGLDTIANGEWIVTRAEHCVSSGGLFTRLDAQRRDDFVVEIDE
jgi:phage protein D